MKTLVLIKALSCHEHGHNQTGKLQILGKINI